MTNFLHTVAQSFHRKNGLFNSLNVRKEKKKNIRKIRLVFSTRCERYAIIENRKNATTFSKNRETNGRESRESKGRLEMDFFWIEQEK